MWIYTHTRNHSNDECAALHDLEVQKGKNILIEYEDYNIGVSCSQESAPEKRMFHYYAVLFSFMTESNKFW